MANAQTKLSASEKQDLKELKEILKNAELFQDVEGTGATVLMMPARDGDTFESAKFVRVAVAYASATENKVRRKVGQFLVAHRMYLGGAIVLEKYDALTLADSMGLYEGNAIPFADA